MMHHMCIKWVSAMQVCPAHTYTRGMKRGRRRSGQSSALLIPMALLPEAQTGGAILTPPHPVLGTPQRYC